MGTQEGIFCSTFTALRQGNSQAQAARAEKDGTNQGHRSPRGKTGVFLASPTDFRYAEMRRDRNFRFGHEGEAKWIEFSGGHRLPPVGVYEEAADRLEGHRL